MSIPYSLCVNSARSRLLSLVDPPAPQVILIARGSSAASREIRASKFANPCKDVHDENPTESSTTVNLCKHLTNFICPWREEFESEEWSL